MDDTVKVLLSEGNISQAARLRKEIAEYFETKNEIELAIAEYEKSAELYDMEENDTYTNQCRQKMAELGVGLAKVDYEKIIGIYESVIASYLQKDLLKGSAKGMLLKVCLLYLANDDIIGSRNRSEKFAIEDPAFGASKESELLANLYASRDANDKAMFEKVTYEYNRVHPFDRTAMKILEKVKGLYAGFEEVDLTGKGKEEEEEKKEPDLT